MFVVRNFNDAKELGLFANMHGTPKPSEMAAYTEKVKAFISSIKNFLSSGLKKSGGADKAIGFIYEYMTNYRVLNLREDLMDDLARAGALPVGERLEIVNVVACSCDKPDCRGNSFQVKHPSVDEVEKIQVLDGAGIPSLNTLVNKMTAPVVSASIEGFISVVSRLININSQKQPKQQDVVVTSQPGGENPVNKKLVMIRQYLSGVCSLDYSSPNRPVLSQDLLDELSSMFNLPEEELEKLSIGVTKILSSDKYGLEQFNNTTGLIRAVLKNNLNIGDRVVLSGLKADEFNGKPGVIVAPGWTTGSNGGSRLSVEVDGKVKLFRISNLSKQVGEPIVEAAAETVRNQHGLSCDDVRKGCISAVKYCGSLFSWLSARANQKQPHTSHQAASKKTN